jgi:hypothetical protein
MNTEMHGRRGMKVRELLEYLSKADPDATVFVETVAHRLEAVNILEDSRGLYISSEE